MGTFKTQLSRKADSLFCFHCAREKFVNYDEIGKNRPPTPVL